jgi:hypothetical protein
MSFASCVGVKSRWLKDTEAAAASEEELQACVPNCVAPKLEPAKAKGIAGAAIFFRIKN